jgi:hypothetical protein
LKATALEGHRTLRIATHCGELPPEERTPIGRVANEIAPWREAFAYQLVRAAGLEAPRARPATITYLDSGNGGAPLRRKAAFIETTGDIADRLGAKESFVVDSEEASAEAPADIAGPERMDPREIVHVHFAEALVGNADFRLNTQFEKWFFLKSSPEVVTSFWNMKAVRMPDGKERPVPVDFDISSLVAPQTGPALHPKIWGGASGTTRVQFSVLQGARVRFPRALLDDARRDFAAREKMMTALLATPWLDPEAARTARELMTAFFALMNDDRAFFVDVVDDAEPEYVRKDGTPDDECITTAIESGTPIVRLGNANEKLGLEEVILLDVRFQLPCNEETVWVKKGIKTTTIFPR